MHRTVAITCIAAVLITGHLTAASCVASSAATAPAVSGATLSAACATPSNYWVVFKATSGGGTAVYTFAHETGAMNSIAGRQRGSSSVAVDGNGTDARFTDGITVVACVQSLNAMYIIDGKTIRAVTASGLVTTVLQDTRIDSTTRIAERNGLTLISFGPCLYSATSSTTSLDLKWILGDCANPLSTSFSSTRSPNQTVPIISTLGLVGPLYLMYSASAGQLFHYHTANVYVQASSLISTDIVEFVTTTETLVAFFTELGCEVNYINFASSGATNVVLLGGTTPSSCAGGSLVAATVGTAADSWYELRRSASGPDSVSLTGCPLTSSSSAPVPTTTAPSSASDSSISDGALIGIVVGSVVALLIVSVVVAVVLVKHFAAAATPTAAPAGGAPQSREPRDHDVRNHGLTNVERGSVPAAIEIPAADPFELSRERPSTGTPARILSPHFIDQMSKVSSSHFVGEGLPGDSLTTLQVSEHKRRTQDSAPDHFIITALSRGDFNQSQTAISLADLERHNKRCEYVAAGAYQKGKLLGRGANGSVYAILLKDGSTIAMKEISLLGAEEEIRSQMQEVQQECQLLQHLQHENLVTYYGVQCDHDQLIVRLFMECVTGGCLGAMVRSMDERLSEDTARIFTYQIVKGLAFIHSQGIVHRDLKCDNILRDAHTGLIKLADFGTAKKIGNATNASRAAQTMIGTPQMMAPEILLAGMGESGDAGYGTKADIWSLGITVAEMVNKGNFPWPSFPSPGHAFLYIASPQGVPTMPDGLSAECQDFIRKCTDRDPKTRPTAAELLLHDWLIDILDDNAPA